MSHRNQASQLKGELGFKLRQVGRSDWRATRKLIGKDLARVSLGLLVSLILAICINPVIRAELMGL